MAEPPMRELKPVTKLALWVLAVASLAMGVIGPVIALAAFCDGTSAMARIGQVIGTGAMFIVGVVFTVWGLAGCGVCVWTAWTSRLPRWLPKAQSEEFEKLFSKPKKFVALAALLAVVLVSFSLWFLSLLLSGK